VASSVRRLRSEMGEWVLMPPGSGRLTGKVFREPDDDVPVHCKHVIAHRPPAHRWRLSLVTYILGPAAHLAATSRISMYPSTFHAERPTNSPSTPGSARISVALPAFTEPP